MSQPDSSDKQIGKIINGLKELLPELRPTIALLKEPTARKGAVTLLVFFLGFGLLIQAIRQDVNFWQLLLAFAFVGLFFLYIVAKTIQMDK